MPHALIAFLIHWAVLTLLLWAASHVFKGISYSSPGALWVAALLLGLVNAVVRPILVLLTLPLTILTLGLFLLVTQMLPEILIIIPLYIIYRRLNMLDSLPALSLVDAAFALPICIWILKGVFDTVPSEVLDAAVVDGCTELSVLWKIVLPLSAPGLVAVAVVSFFSAWNEFLFAVIMLSSAEFQPASVGLTTLKATGFTPVEQYMAAGLIFSILPVFFYLIMQRYIVEGVTATGIKG
jgi:multiple sugar transport system permease protein